MSNKSKKRCCFRNAKAQSTQDAGRDVRANWNVFPLMLLACSVDTPIDINRSHLLVSRCASRPASCVDWALRSEATQRRVCLSVSAPYVSPSILVLRYMYLCTYLLEIELLVLREKRFLLLYEEGLVEEGVSGRQGQGSAVGAGQRWAAARQPRGRGPGGTPRDSVGCADQLALHQLTRAARLLQRLHLQVQPREGS